jgi:hypothetical protein
LNREIVHEAIFEHRFWLHVLGDHARFILDAMSPREKEEIRSAESFITAFDSLLTQSRQITSAEDVNL